MTETKEGDLQSPPRDLAMMTINWYLPVTMPGAEGHGRDMILPVPLLCAADAALVDGWKHQSYHCFRRHISGPKGI